MTSTITLQTHQTMEPTQSWETWHRRFGHISYTGLKQLIDKSMVEGLTVDQNSPKLDCEACI